MSSVLGFSVWRITRRSLLQLLGWIQNQKRSALWREYCKYWNKISENKLNIRLDCWKRMYVCIMLRYVLRVGARACVSVCVCVCIYDVFGFMHDEYVYWECAFYSLSKYFNKLYPSISILFSAFKVITIKLSTRVVVTPTSIISPLPHSRMHFLL